MENMNTDVRVSRVDFPLPPTPFSLPLHNGNFYLHCQRGGENKLVNQTEFLIKISHLDHKMF